MSAAREVTPGQRAALQALRRIPTAAPSDAFVTATRLMLLTVEPEQIHSNGRAGTRSAGPTVGRAMQRRWPSGSLARARAVLISAGIVVAIALGGATAASGQTSPLYPTKQLVEHIGKALGLASSPEVTGSSPAPHRVTGTRHRLPRAAEARDRDGASLAAGGPLSSVAASARAQAALSASDDASRGGIAGVAPAATTAAGAGTVLPGVTGSTVLPGVTGSTVLPGVTGSTVLPGVTGSTVLPGPWADGVHAIGTGTESGQAGAATVKHQPAAGAGAPVADLTAAAPAIGTSNAGSGASVVPPEVEPGATESTVSTPTAASPSGVAVGVGVLRADVLKAGGLKAGVLCAKVLDAAPSRVGAAGRQDAVGVGLVRGSARADATPGPISTVLPAPNGASTGTPRTEGTKAKAERKRDKGNTRRDRSGADTGSSPRLAGANPSKGGASLHMPVVVAAPSPAPTVAAAATLVPTPAPEPTATASA